MGRKAKYVQQPGETDAQFAARRREIQRAQMRAANKKRRDEKRERDIAPHEQYWPERLHRQRQMLLMNIYWWRHLCPECIPIDYPWPPVPGQPHPQEVAMAGSKKEVRVLFREMRRTLWKVIRGSSEWMPTSPKVVRRILPGMVEEFMATVKEYNRFLATPRFMETSDEMFPFEGLAQTFPYPDIWYENRQVTGAALKRFRTWKDWPKNRRDEPWWAQAITEYDSLSNHKELLDKDYEPDKDVLQPGDEDVQVSVGVV